MLELTDLLPLQGVNDHDAVLDYAAMLVVLQGHGAIVRLGTFHHFLLGPVPTVAGQSADESAGHEVSFAQGHHLAAQFLVAVLSLHGAGVLALYGVVGIDLGGIGGGILLRVGKRNRKSKQGETGEQTFHDAIQLRKSMSGEKPRLSGKRGSQQARNALARRLPAERPLPLGPQFPSKSSR